MYGRSNLNKPSVSVSGDDDNLNYTTTFREEEDVEIFIVSPQVAFFDADLDSVIESVTVTLTNPQLPSDQEYLKFVPTGLQFNSTPHEITMYGQFHNSLYEASLLSVFYHNEANEPIEIPRVILFSVSDGQNVNFPKTQTTIEVITFNDEPKIYLDGESFVPELTVEFIEGTLDNEVTPLLPNLTIVDPDSSYMVSAQIELVEVFDYGNESIFVNTSLLAAYGISCNIPDCDGQTLELAGNASQAVYEDILRSLTYFNEKKPEEFPSLFDRYINLTIVDSENANSVTMTVVVDIITPGGRRIIELDAPNLNYTFTYREDSNALVPIAGSTRVVDVSLANLVRMFVQILNPLSDENLSLDTTCVSQYPVISALVNSATKEIVVALGTEIEEFRGVIDCLAYNNTEKELAVSTRYISFLFVPGGGAPNSTAYTIINIETINDNAPVCSSSESVEFSESTDVNDIVHTVVAVDADLGGSDGEIVYAILQGDDSFDISLNVDGMLDILLIDKKNYESEEKMFPVVIEACDQGTPQLCCNFTIDFVVTDTNDNAPVFNDAPHTVSVPENDERILVTFNITDADTGPNQELFSLEVGPVYPMTSACLDKFETGVSPPTLSTINGGLDYEGSQTCYVMVIATDDGSPSKLTVSTNVTVKVENTDDIAPKLVPPFSFSVSENNTVPTSVGFAAATDEDSLSLEYSLVGADSSQFSINGTTGELVILFVTDLAKEQEHLVTIRVTDPAGNFDEEEYTIGVLPINNDPPVLILNSKNVIFVEESGTPVLLVSNPEITDPDNVTLTIDRISAIIANGADSDKETLSLASNAPEHTIISSDNPFELLIVVSHPTNISQVSELIRSIQYLNTEDEFSSCRDDLHACVSPLSRTILVSVSDTMFFSKSQEAVVELEVVNDAPVVRLDTSMSRTLLFEEGSSPVQIVKATTYSVTDDDDENLQSLQCTHTNAVDGSAEALLVLGTVPDNITVSGNDSHAVTFTGDALVSDYATALGLVYYFSSSANPTAVDRLVNCSASDAADTSNTAVATITYNTVDNPPVIQLDKFSFDYIEEEGNISLATAATSITDLDSTELLTLSVEISPDDSYHRLSLNSSLAPEGGTVVSTGSLILVAGKASLEMYTEILRAVMYENTLDEFPADLGSATVTFDVTDVSNTDSTSVSVSINFDPVDDNPPVFTEPSYTFNISELAKTGEVGRVIVTDADLPVPQNPSFIITGGNILGDFQIVNDPTSPLEGVISVAKALDYDEKAMSYKLTVRASSGAYVIETTVTIIIINENDLDIYFDTDVPAAFTVFESHSQANSLSDTIRAVDPDNFPITYSVVSPYVRVGAVDSNGATLVLIPPVDRETVPGRSFNITILATDGASNASITRLVEVLDVNEVAPEFDKDMYNVTIIENDLPSGIPLLNVTAIDGDEVPDSSDDDFESLITFSLVDNEFNHLFNMTSDGLLYQMEAIDVLETGPKFSIFIEATDNGNPPQLSTAEVQVTIININDEAPTFVNFVSEIVIFEAPKTQFDIVIQGEDADSDSNLTYSLTSSVPSNPFTINPFNGRIMKTDVPLDVDAPDAIRSYPLLITLTDLNTDPAYPNSTSVSETLTIVVKDVNSEVPEFVGTPYTVEIQENVPAADGGSFVLSAMANDGDYGLDPSGVSNGYSNVTYSLVGEPADIFKIDPSTGTIYRMEELNREESASHMFQVVAKDNPVDGSDSNIAVVPVVITVRDVNEHPPEADPSEYYATIKEDATGTITTQVQVKWNSLCEY